MSSNWTSSDQEGLAATEAIPPGRASSPDAIPPGRPIPPGRAIPPGRPIPAGRAIPPGRPIPPGRAIPPGRPIPPGRAIPPGRPIPPGRGDQLAEVLDPAQWGAALATLFYERSAVVRLGARLVAAEHRVPLLAIDRAAKPPAYVQPGGAVPEGKDGTVGLDPRKFKLGAVVRVSSERFDAAMENAELIGLLLEDLAEALALRADRAFLAGPGGDVEPKGIKRRDQVHKVKKPKPGADDLETAREILKTLRDEQHVVFRNPGWVLHPATFDRLTRELTLPSGNPLDASPLLAADGSDGGTLLGYPFVTSEAAKEGERKPTMFFSADWSEAWIGADPALATVEISTSAAFASDDILIRAVMRHDFTLRRPEFFAISPPDSA
jgi:HK97 family phage major capsid protein